MKGLQVDAAPFVMLILEKIEALWQAYKAPASLGVPLSVPAACGLYEIFHLKEHLNLFS
jgi:hypothetical protein